ncbi:MAG: formate dehydrogenase accessory sulfurtransferase FdhD [Chloroflexota bacterium]|nr:formate dehydrogenase accessory sulfurtransferase FdhD [Chloroflexota bacterium]
MKNTTEKLSILRVTKQSKSSIEDIVVKESALTIIVNNKEVTTLLCSPTKLKYLAMGFLCSHGLIKSKREVKEIKLRQRKRLIQAEITKAINAPANLALAPIKGRGSASINAQKISMKPEITITAGQVLSLMEDFVSHSRVFKATGGVHSAALCNADNILIFSEDIGRHNAIDKILGECLLKDIPTDGHLIITSGRVSSEIVLKVAKKNIPVLISKAAPTDLGVSLADNSGVTLIGFAREKRMNIYTHAWRVVSDGEVVKLGRS